MPTKPCTIRYFRAERGSIDGSWPQNGDVVTAIHNALVNETATPYIRNGEQLYIVELHEKRPLHVSVATVRRDNLPLLEHGGRTTALSLDAEDNLAEPTHFIFFGSRIVAMVRSQLTPGHLVGGNVLSRRCNLDLALVPILRPEVEALIVNSIGVAEVEVRIAGSSFDRAAASAGDPVEAVRQLTDTFSGAGIATVKMRATTAPDRQRFRSWLVQQIRERELGNGRKGVESFRATVLDREGERQLVDLLQDQIAQREQVQTSAATRYLDPEDVRRAVEGNFEEQRAMITRAIELHAD